MDEIRKQLGEIPMLRERLLKAERDLTAKLHELDDAVRAFGFEHVLRMPINCENRHHRSGPKVFYKKGKDGRWAFFVVGKFEKDVVEEILLASAPTSLQHHAVKFLPDLLAQMAPTIEEKVRFSTQGLERVSTIVETIREATKKEKKT